MKKIGCVLFCCIFLCGCVLPGKIDKDTVLSDVKLITESLLPTEQTEQEMTAQEVKADNSNDYLQSADVFTDDIKAELMRKQQDLYYFSNLEITQQNVYAEIYG